MRTELACVGSRTPAPGASRSTSWRRLVHTLRDSLVEKVITTSQEHIRRDAHMAGVDERTFEIQVRLHVPSIPNAELRSRTAGEVYEMVRSIALTQSAEIRQGLEDAELYANTSLLIKQYTAKKSLTLESLDGDRLPLRFGAVKPSVGHLYQRRLHYLRAARSDTHLQCGIYLPGGIYPITYAAFSACDRPYIADSLIAEALHCPIEECLVLTRMYGLPGIPTNLISLTLKHAIRALRRSAEYRLLLTAFNPMLGFTGAAFQASGFYPFAVAPVAYHYTDRGNFVTRRGRRSTSRHATGTPPNVLTVRGIDRSMQKNVIESVDVTSISMDDHAFKTKVDGKLPVCESAFLDQLFQYRMRLERAWSDQTIHPSYLSVTDRGPRSRGQCGVSSVWLARELRKKHHADATYCYGDLVFTDSRHRPVLHHCWIEIGSEGDPSRHVIDITCDQAEALDEPVLYQRHDELVRQGLDYRARTRLTLDELPDDRVWHRFLALSDAVDSDVDMITTN